MKNIIISLMAVLCLVSVTACKEKLKREANFQGKVNPYEYADSILGKWTGPEGTFLEISRDKKDNYTVTVQNLDGPRTFDGEVTEGGLQFKRDGKVETIQMGDGQDTGMKYLTEKVDCLIINAGEGYCRD